MKVQTLNKFIVSFINKSFNITLNTLNNQWKVREQINQNNNNGNINNNNNKNELKTSVNEIVHVKW